MEHILYEPHRIALPRAFSQYFLTTACDDQYGETKSRNWFVLLQPDQSIKDLFGIGKEIMCLVSEFDSFQVRTLDYADRVLRKFGHRVTEDSFILVTSADAAGFCEDYLNLTGRTVILCTWSEICTAQKGFSLDLLRRYLFSRDLFHQNSPVSNDFQFFARNKTVDEILDDLRNGQNRGIFGLRKTGKTSVLQRVLDKNRLSEGFLTAFLDAQSPTISEGNASSVALEIARHFNREFAHTVEGGTGISIPRTASLQEAAPILENTMQHLVGNGKRCLLVVDELERILPHSKRVNNWHSEYLKLWRLLRAISQSLSGKFVFLLASTNPFFVEESVFDEEDNPLYAFIKGTFLGLFSADDLSYMISTLGRRMGITFDDEALKILYEEYGGHPYLSRQLCSFLAQNHKERPLTVSAAIIRDEIQIFFERVFTDLDAILKVFQEFYPDEHSVMQLLAESQVETSQYLSANPLLMTHLKGYGIVKVVGKDRVAFTMRALRDYYLRPRSVGVEAPKIVPEVNQRFEILDKRTLAIELRMRGIVSTIYMTNFRDKWRHEISINCQESTLKRIESRCPVTQDDFMQELELKDLFQAVSRKFQLFAGLFFSRDTFNRITEDVVEARRIIAHRRFGDLQDDSLFYKLDNSSKWIVERLNI